MKITRITERNYTGYVYDIEMAGTPNFFANNIVIHNCAKKRYAINVYDNEGVRYAEPKIKIMGLEIVRSSTPKPIRQILKDAVKITLTGDEKQLQDFCASSYAEYQKMDPEEIAYPRGVKRLDHYSDHSSIYAKGCPIHVRAALLHNHYVTQYKMEEKYSLIQDGDKMKFITLKTPNPIRENVIAFVDKFPDEIISRRYIDYDGMWEKSFLAPLETILNSIGWKHEEQASLDDFFS